MKGAHRKYKSVSEVYREWMAKEQEPPEETQGSNGKYRSITQAYNDWLSREEEPPTETAVMEPPEEPPKGIVGTQEVPTIDFMEGITTTKDKAAELFRKPEKVIVPKDRTRTQEVPTIDFMDSFNATTPTKFRLALNQKIPELQRQEDRELKNRVKRYEEYQKENNKYLEDVRKKSPQFATIPDNILLKWRDETARIKAGEKYAEETNKYSQVPNFVLGLQDLITTQIPEAADFTLGILQMGIGDKPGLSYEVGKLREPIQQYVDKMQKIRNIYKPQDEKIYSIGNAIGTGAMAYIGGFGGALVSKLAGFGTLGTEILGGIGSFAQSYSLEGGAAYSTAKRYGLSDSDALAYGNVTGLVNAPLDVAPVLLSLKKFGITDAALNEVKKEIGETLFKKTFRDKIIEFGKDIIEQSQAEGVTEAMQEITPLIQESLYMKAKDKPGFMDWWDRIGQSYFAGLIMGGFFGGGGTAFRLMQENKQLAKQEKELDELFKKEIGRQILKTTSLTEDKDVTLGFVNKEGRVVFPKKKEKTERPFKKLAEAEEKAKTKAETIKKLFMPREEQQKFEREIPPGREKREEGVTNKKLRQVGIEKRTKENIAEQKKTERQRLREEQLRKSQQGIRYSREKNAVKKLTIDFRKAQKEDKKFDDKIVGRMAGIIENPEAKEKLGKIYSQILEHNRNVPEDTEYAEQNEKSAQLYGIMQYAEGKEESKGEMPANESGERVSTRRQGKEVQPDEEAIDKEIDETIQKLTQLTEEANRREQEKKRESTKPATPEVKTTEEVQKEGEGKKGISKVQGIIKAGGTALQNKAIRFTYKGKDYTFDAPVGENHKSALDKAVKQLNEEFEGKGTEIIDELFRKGEVEVSDDKGNYNEETGTQKVSDQIIEKPIKEREKKAVEEVENRHDEIDYSTQSIYEETFNKVLDEVSAKFGVDKEKLRKESEFVAEPPPEETVERISERDYRDLRSGLKTPEDILKEKEVKQPLKINKTKQIVFEEQSKSDASGYRLGESDNAFYVIDPFNHKTYEFKFNIKDAKDRLSAMKEADKFITDNPLITPEGEIVTKPLISKQTSPKTSIPTEKNPEEIGKNKYGETLYEDKKGVRYKLEGNIKISEPVSMTPTKAGIEMGTPRTDEDWLTTDEIKPTEKKAGTDVKKRILDLHQAGVLGREAFDKGLKRVPAQDPALMELIKGYKVGESKEMTKNWLKNWDYGNLGEELGSEYAKKQGIKPKTSTEKIDEIDEQIDDIIKEMMFRAGKKIMPEEKSSIIPGLDPEQLGLGIKLTGLYIKRGFYKLHDILKQIHDKYGEETLRKLFYPVKQAYSAHLTTQALDKEAGKMSDLGEIRKLTVEDILKLGIRKQEEEKPEKTNNEKFIDDIRDKIRTGTRLNKAQLDKLGRERGIKSSHLIKELAEVAILLEGRESIAKYKDEKKKFDILKYLYDFQPNLTARSSTSVKGQQYSTPVPTSYIAGLWIGGEGSGKVLEPSAGNGLLTIALRPQDVTVNELDDIRNDNLVKYGKYNEVTKRDATKPFDGKYNGIITNPPFGSIKPVKFDGYTIKKKEHLMALNALQNMKDNGRASIIIGKHQEYDKNGTLKKDVVFFNYLYSHYNVADVINIDGGLYKKQGTSYDIRMILIDGRKAIPTKEAAPNISEVDNTVVKTFDQLYERVTGNEDFLYPGAYADTRGGTTSDVQSPGELQPEEQTGVTTVLGGQVSPADTKTPVQTTRGSRVRSGKTPTGKSMGGKQQGPSGTNIKKPSIQESNKPQKPGRGNTPETEGGRGTLRGDLSGGTNKHTATDIIDADASIRYRPKSQGVGLETLIPKNQAMDTERVLDELSKEVGDIDEYVKDRLGYKTIDDMQGNLSAEQIDGIALSIYQVERGEAMIIGDNAGVGKGRIAASMIRYGVNQGKKPIFFTATADLYSDLYRDMIDSGNGNADMVPFIVNNRYPERNPDMVDKDGNVVYESLKWREKKAILESGDLEGYDYVVITYSQINSKRYTARRNFIEELAKDNILIFDESHLASGESETSEYVQDLVANAKGVTFLSATYAKNPNNMPVYAIKTGLKEAGLSRDQLIDAIKEGGVALQEIVAGEFVSTGQMIRREKSFEGVKITYPVLTEKKTEHRAIADNVSEILREIIDFQDAYVKPIINGVKAEIRNAGENVQVTQGTDMAGINNAPMTSKVHNVVDQLLFALKVDDVAKIAIEQIKQNKKPVVAFKNTMASFLNDMGFQIGETIDNSDFGLVIMRALNGVMRYTTRLHNGDVITNTYSPDELGAEGKAEYNRIANKIKEKTIGITISPIDRLIYLLEQEEITDPFTGEKRKIKVGEVTGRDMRIEFKKEGATFEKRDDKKDRKKTYRGFNNGQIDVMLMNAAASTGISIHASSTFKDTRQRVMISHQIELNINTEVQKRLRIHRNGQVVLPEYINLTTAVPMEQRLMMIARKKLKSLDANISSDQEVGGERILESQDFMNKYGDEIVIEYLIENPDINEMMKDPLRLNTESPNTENAATRVTGRAAILPAAQQEEFYSEINARYSDYIDYLNQINANDLEIKVLPLNAVTTGQRMMAAGKGGKSPFGQNTMLETVEVDVLRKPFTREQIDKAIEKYLDGENRLDKKNKLINKFERHFTQQLERELEGKVNLIHKQTEKYGVTKEEIRKILNLVENNPEDEIGPLGISANQSSISILLNMLIDKKTNGTVKPKKSLLHIGEGWAGRRKAMEIVKEYVTDKIFDRFDIGKVYKIPLVTTGVMQTYSDGVFLGWQINEKKKNPYAPSSIGVRFAVADSRQVIDYPGSKSDILTDIYSESLGLDQWQQDDILDDWDNIIPQRNREIVHIATGNLLLAISEANGQLTAFTTRDGEIRRGLILNKSSKHIKETQDIRVPIKRALSFIQNLPFNRYIETTDGKVTLIKKDNYYEILVPASKKQGGQYYLNEELLKVVDNEQFEKVGKSMVSRVPSSELRKLVTVLEDVFGASVRLSAKEIDSIKNKEKPDERNRRLGEDETGEGEGNIVDLAVRLFPKKTGKKSQTKIHEFSPAIKKFASNRFVLENIYAHHKDSKLINKYADVQYGYDKPIFGMNEDGDIILSAEDWKNEYGYNVIEYNFKKLKPGDKGYVEGKILYKANVEGSTIEPSEKNGWRGKVVYTKSTKMDTGIEEPIHILQAVVTRENPKLAKGIKSWQDDVVKNINRELQRKGEEELSKQEIKELLPKVFLNQAGYTKHLNLPSLPDEVFNGIISMLNDSHSGEKIYDKYLKPQRLNQPASSKRPDTKGYTFEQGLHLLSAKQPNAPPSSRAREVNPVDIIWKNLKDKAQEKRLRKAFGIDVKPGAFKYYREMLTSIQWYFDKEPQLRRIWDVVDRLFVRNINEEIAILREDKWKNTKPFRKLNPAQQRGFLRALKDYEYSLYELMRDGESLELLTFEEFIKQYKLDAKTAAFVNDVYRPTIEQALDYIKDIDRYHLLNTNTKNNPFLEDYNKKSMDKRFGAKKLENELQKVKDEFFEADPNAEFYFEQELVKQGDKVNEIIALNKAWGNNPDVRERAGETLIEKKYEQIDGKMYFPSSRLGKKYYLSAKRMPTKEEKLLEGKQIERFFTTDDNLAKLNRLKNELIAEGYTIDPKVVKGTGIGLFKNVEEEILQNEITQENILDLALLSGIEADNPTIDKLLKVIQAKGFTRHFIHKRYIPGFEYTNENFEKAIYKYINGVPFYKNRTIGNIELNKTMRELKANGTLDPKKNPHEYKYVEKFILQMNTRDEALSQALRAAAAVWYLALRVSYIGQQLVQNINTLLPYLPVIEKELGLKMGDAEKAFGESFVKIIPIYGWKIVDKIKRVTGKNWEVPTFGLDEDFLNMMRSLERQGVGKPLRTMEMMGWQVDPERYYNPNPITGGLKWMGKIIGFPGILIEDITRMQAMRAMYMMGKKAGLSGDAMQDFISRNVAKTHGPASGKQAKAPWYTFKGVTEILRVLRSVVQSILTFKNFPFMNFGQWGKSWRMLKKHGMIRPLLYKFGGVAAMGGVKYMMWTSTMFTLLSAIYSFFDYPEDPEEQWEEAVKTLNKAVPGLGDAIYSGLSSLHFNIDLGALLAQQAPFITEDIEFRGEGVLAGAGWQLAADIISGVLEKNPKKLVPSGIRNQIIANEWEEKGVTWGRRTLIPKDEVTKQDVVKKRLGFTPLKVSKAYREEDKRQKLSKTYSNIIKGEVTDKIMPMLRSGKNYIAKGEFLKLYNKIKKKNVWTKKQKEDITNLEKFVSQYVIPRLEGDEKEAVMRWREKIYPPPKRDRRKTIERNYERY